MTLRYDDIPPQLPKETQRVDPDGSASEFQFESEAATTAWFKARAQDLNTRTFTIKDQTDANTAAITLEQSVRTSEDEALAEQILTVQANVGDVQATVTDVITAYTAADTALAADITTVSTELAGNTADLAVLQSSYNGLAVNFSVTGTLNNLTGGFQFSGVQKNDGSASYAIEFNVNDFRIYNPSLGTTIPMFSYSGTLNRFTFNAPVYIGETEIGAGQSNDVRELPYDGQALSGSTGSLTTYIQNAFSNSLKSITLTTKTALIMSGFTRFAMSGTGGANYATFVRIRNSGGTVVALLTLYTTNGIPNQVNNSYNNIDIPATVSAVLSSGTYSFDVYYNYASASPGVTLTFSAQQVNVFLFRNVT